jgi:hypothetical protein
LAGDGLEELVVASWLVTGAASIHLENLSTATSR